MVAVSSDRPGVLVVDDSALLRALVSGIIMESGEFAVAGEAADGVDALTRCAALDPAVVTLDIEMPGLSGLEALGYLMSESPRPVVILSGATTTGGQDLVVQALELGAVDFVRKPSVGDALDVETLRHRVLQALRTAVGRRVEAGRVVPPRPWRRAGTVRPAAPAAEATPARGVVVVAASTGGPRALAELCAGLELPAGFAAVIVQHMPSGFTASLATRLDALAPCRVSESTPGQALLAGEAIVLAGGQHWVMERTPAGARLVHDLTAVGTLRPAADPLIESAVRTFGRNVAVVVLTGMGRDGASGARAVRRAGGHVLVQSPETAVIAGMPQAAIDAAGADWSGPIARLGAAIPAVCAGAPRVSRRP